MSSEQRESVRYLPKKNAYAALGRGVTLVGQINDISKGGVAFEHLIHLDGEKNNFNDIDIFLEGQEFFLHGLSCVQVYDSPVNAGAVFDPLLITKRCGVKFGLLTDKQMSKLEYFLENHTIGPSI